MEKIVEQSLLFDFYGELLTDHQQNVYQDAVFNDMSLSEVADNYGISRQGVHDLLKRCDKTMQEYEDKLHLISKFSAIRDKLTSIQELADTMNESCLQEDRRRIHHLAAEILEEL
ncbi:MAG: YlxM family DNA-binding protein [Lachnospiraceae bacterium]|nr:YlxM family DNA-binding protein [Lachnospiraceae bacterium]